MINLTVESDVIDEKESLDENENLTSQQKFLFSLARAFGGALLFALPMLMTVEIWELGLYIYPLRLALFLFLAIPLLTGFSWYSGFKATNGLKEDLVDAFVAYAVGFCASAIALALLTIVGKKTSTAGIVAMVSLQAVPASIGALLAQSQFGNHTRQETKKKEEAGYWEEIFLMIAGAVFFAFNLAPGDEVVVIGYKMTVWNITVIAILSLVLMQAFVYSLRFRGQEISAPDAPFGQTFFRFTVVGYAIALLTSFYILWTFGRIDGLSAERNLTNVIILAFPATIGAAVTRLIL